MTLRRTALWCGAGLAALLGVAALTVALAVYRPQLVRPWVQRALTPRGGTASLAALKLSISPPALELSGLAIAGPPQEGELLRLDHMKIEMIPGRLLHGGPWLRRVEARGLVFERLRPREAEGPPDLAPLTRLFDIEDLSLSDARLRVALPQGDFAADGIRLSLIPGEGGIRRFSGSGKLTFRRKDGTVAEGELLAQGTVTPGPAIEGTLELAAAASATLEGKEARLEVSELDIGGRPDTLRRMDLTGSLPFRVELSARGTERVLVMELLPRDLLFSWPAKALDCRFGGSLRAEGPFQDWLHGKAGLSGRIEGTGRIQQPPLEVRRFRFHTSLSGEIAAPALPGWKLSAEAGAVTYEGRPLPLGPVEIGGSARQVDPSWRVEGLDIRSGSLGRMTGELSFLEGGIGGRLNGARLPADNLVSLAQALSGRKGGGWSPTGAFDLAARLEPAVGGSRIAATATLGRIGFTSPSGDVMGQGLAGRIDLEALLVAKPRFKADLTLRQGEALWKTVYVDLAKDPLDLHAKGTREGPEEYADLSLEGVFGGFGRLGIEGKARQARGTWRHQGRIALGDARLGPIFRTFLRDPMAASQPDLAGLETDGTAELDLTFSGSGKTADLAGALRLRSGDVRRGKEPPRIEGLDIDLPIAYSLGAGNPGQPKPPDAAKWGRLRLKKLRLAGQELGPLEMPAVLVPNRLYLGGSIDTTLLGARVSLRRIWVGEPLSPNFRIHMAAQLDGLDLARVAGDNSMLEGSLGGLLDPVSIGRERMTAAGELTGELYGGRLDIRNVTMERPFGAGREIGADVNVRQMDLERLSENLGVGRITGRLSGSAEGLRFAYGQPVAFHLKMESVTVKGVDQTVSLKAVNSISTVSTGSGLSGLGASLMAKFFREFSYEKIGFECGLKNDVFTVRGLILEDGVEYLVKRRFLSGINVINHTRDNRIGFSDMLERAKRVTREDPE
ncbi:MAG: hypothetical protein IH577_01570 [Deltaproteobacteria bacterium]|nr:hypothetical protein [Deltaproteobacteria bacterium]